MSNLCLARALSLLLILSAAPAQAASFAKKGLGVADIHGEPRPMTLTAPDGRTRAIARFSDWKGGDSDSRLSVFVGGDDHDFPGGQDSELLWAPDSNAIAVTADDSDAEGGFETSILVRPEKGRHWHRFDLTDKIADIFAPKMRCDDDDERPNVAAVGWTSGQRLIVVAQVPRHAGCANGGQYAGFIVDTATGAVLMDVDAAMLRTRYRHMLGTALLPAAKHRHHHRRHQG